ncbi:M23 family metallopeptidase [Nitrospira defluvii]|nr:M23 family metallopeptidase [Nitrospira defluvii]
MAQSNDSYTVVIFSGTKTSEPYRLSVRKGAIKLFIGFSVVFSMVLAAFSFQYYLMWGQLEDVTSLRKENKTQKVQIQGFSNTIEDLKNQVVRLVEFDRKLRVMTDIGPPKGSTSAFGIGGSDEQQIASYAALDLSGVIHRDLELLQSHVVQQDKSFQELEEVVHDRQSLWASTPSIWPTSGWLTSSFGKRISPFSGRLANHNGIDIAARPGTPIIAPASGVVTYSKFNGGFGRFLKLNHGYGVVTHYGHLSKVDVKVGQKVKRGDVIAYVGNTGLSTGPHLHYEVSVNKVPINPMTYILN